MPGQPASPLVPEPGPLLLTSRGPRLLGGGQGGKACGVALSATSTIVVLAGLVRIVATVYVDVFRGVPLILVIYALGFGLPALRFTVVSTQTSSVYGVLALVLSYSAYVSEVFRAGLNAVHPSQIAAARAIGLRPWPALRHVILPQAIRNVIPRCSTTSSACRRTPPWSASSAPSRPTAPPRSTARPPSTTPATWSPPPS